MLADQLRSMASVLAELGIPDYSTKETRDLVLALRDMTPVGIPHLGLCLGSTADCEACKRTNRAREVLARHKDVI